MINLIEGLTAMFGGILANSKAELSRTILALRNALRSVPINLSSI